MWKDITRYSRSCIERKPTTWAIGAGDIMVVITCSHVHYKGMWIMHCHKLGIDCQQLASDSLEEAKASALHVVRAEFEQLTNDVMRLLHEY